MKHPGIGTIHKPKNTIFSRYPDHDWNPAWGAADPYSTFWPEEIRLWPGAASVGEGMGREIAGNGRLQTRRGEARISKRVDGIRT